MRLTAKNSLAMAFALVFAAAAIAVLAAETRITRDQAGAMGRKGVAMIKTGGKEFTKPVSRQIAPKSMYCERIEDMVVCGGGYE